MTTEFTFLIKASHLSSGPNILQVKLKNELACHHYREKSGQNEVRIWSSKRLAKVNFKEKCALAVKHL